MNEFKVGDKIAALASLDKAKVVKGIVYTVEKVETVHDKYLNAFSFQVIYVKGITDDLLLVMCYSASGASAYMRLGALHPLSAPANSEAR